METPSVIVESLIERFEAYGKTTIELSKLKLLQTATKVGTSSLARLGVMFTFFLFIMVLSIGIALWLGDLMGKLYYGFFIVALFYLIAGIILNAYLHDWLRKPVSKFIISQSLHQ